MSSNSEQSGFADDPADLAEAIGYDVDEGYDWSEYDDDCAPADVGEEHRQGTRDFENRKRKRGATTSITNGR